MDSFELNKIIAAVLLTALIVIGIGKFTNILFHVEKPKESAYKIEGLETVATSTTSTGSEAKVVETVDIKQLLTMGDLAHGEKVFESSQYKGTLVAQPTLQWWKSTPPRTCTTNCPFWLRVATKYSYYRYPRLRHRG